MLDGGRNTDMADGVKGFPSKLHDMIVLGDARQLERLLSETLDVLSAWSSGAVRTEADDRGNAMIASQKAAVTILAGAYYVVRMGSPNCTSPLPSYDPYPSGDEWPGGCPGRWIGATENVSRTLNVVHGHASLRPGTTRRELNVTTGGRGSYAMLRGDSVVVVFNFSPSSVVVGIDVASLGILANASTVTDLINGCPGPSIPMPSHNIPWTVDVDAHGWRVLDIERDA